MDHCPGPAQFGSRLGNRLSFGRGGKLLHQGVFIAHGFLLQIGALLTKDGFIEIKRHLHPPACFGSLWAVSTSHIRFSVPTPARPAWTCSPGDVRHVTIQQGWLREKAPS